MSADFWLGFATGLAVAFGSCTLGFVGLSWALEVLSRRSE
jgi:hypothetical protein